MVGTPKESIKKILQNIHITDKESLDSLINDKRDGCVIPLHTSNGGTRHLIWLFYDERIKKNYGLLTPEFLEVVVHEVSHASRMSLENVGIKYTSESEETYAYFSGWLFKKIYELLKRGL